MTIPVDNMSKVEAEDEVDDVVMDEAEISTQQLQLCKRRKLNQRRRKRQFKIKVRKSQVQCYNCQKLGHYEKVNYVEKNNHKDGTFLLACIDINRD